LLTFPALSLLVRLKIVLFRRVPLMVLGACRIHEGNECVESMKCSCGL
jgi:hypothetical protein